MGKKFDNYIDPDLFLFIEELTENERNTFAGSIKLILNEYNFNPTEFNDFLYSIIADLLEIYRNNQNYINKTHILNIVRNSRRKYDRYLNRNKKIINTLNWIKNKYSYTEELNDYEVIALEKIEDDIKLASLNNPLIKNIFDLLLNEDNHTCIKNILKIDRWKFDEYMSVIQAILKKHLQNNENKSIH